MSNYTINWQSNGTEGVPGKANIILPQRTADSTSTSITLTGRGLPNYGEIQQENFIRLMENFASKDQPANPTVGQFWFNTEQNILYVRAISALAGTKPKYYLASPSDTTCWLQVWPTANSYASLSEYNGLATVLNRIISAPTVFGSDPAAENNQWGWGQTDLVPVYTDASTLAPGFSSAIFPANFNNEAWVILLARARKAARFVGIDEANISPVGFIDDGRPGPEGNTLSNTYNDSGTGGAGTLPNFTSGFLDFGQSTLQVLYTNTVAVVSQLAASRFTKAVLSTTGSSLTGHTRTLAWNSTLSHEFVATFVSENAAKAYFNSGGELRFVFSHAPSIPDAINNAWSAFMASQTLITLDYKGLKRGTVYQPKLAGGSDYLGFYDLTGSEETLYKRDREYGMYNYISDGGIEISGYTTVSGSAFNVHLKISFVEGLQPGETIQGSTSSSLWGYKANSLNMNSPQINFPSVSQAGTFITAPAP